MKQFVKNAADRVSKAYLEHGHDPTEEVAKIARQHNLNAMQIERVANHANRGIIVELQKEAVQDGTDIDPEFTYPTVKTADVVEVIDCPEPEEPSVPDGGEGTSPDLDDIIPEQEDPLGGGEQYDVEDAVEGEGDVDDEGVTSFDFPDRDTAARVIEKLKRKVQEKQQKLHAIERRLDEATARLKKEAKARILNGTPLEVLEGLPGGDQTIQKVAKKYKDHVTYAEDQRVRINDDHPLVKLAEQVEDLKEDCRRAKESYDYQDARLQAAYSEYRIMN